VNVNAAVVLSATNPFGIEDDAIRRFGN